MFYRTEISLARFQDQALFAFVKDLGGYLMFLHLKEKLKDSSNELINFDVLQFNNSSIV
jgi:hypothetical protein